MTAPLTELERRGCLRWDKEEPRKNIEGLNAMLAPHALMVVTMELPSGELRYSVAKRMTDEEELALLALLERNNIA